MKIYIYNDVPYEEYAVHMDKLVEAFFENLERNEDTEFGGWGLDDKRPFGNSYVEGDIARIIGIEIDHDDRDHENLRYVRDLYEDLGSYLKEKWAEFKKKGGKTK